MRTLDDIIQSLGGSQDVAALLGVTVQAISNMKARNSVSPVHWPALVQAGRERGIEWLTLDLLMSMRGRPRGAGRRAA